MEAKNVVMQIDQNTEQLHVLARENAKVEQPSSLDQGPELAKTL
jgi:hypothetical protein